MPSPGYYYMHTEPIDHPVFSPSQTSDFIRDPAAWYLRSVMKWRPRFIGKKEVAGILGTAFADGVAAYHNGLMGPSLDYQLPAEEALIKKSAAVAVQSAQEAKQRVILMGQSVYDDQEESWGLLEKRAAEIIFKYALNRPAIISPKSIIGAEIVLPEHGWCRIDLGIRTELGPMPLDFKTKVTQDVKYQSMFLQENEASWQMLHYTWAFGAYTGETIRRYGIILVVLEPKSRLPLLHPVVVDPELMQIWVQSAKQVWRIMDGMKRGVPVTVDPTPWCSFVFRNKFGREDWADGIQKCFMDENLLRTHYVKEIPR